MTTDQTMAARADLIELTDSEIDAVGGAILIPLLIGAALGLVVGLLAINAFFRPH